jgi:hypothetical protein
MMSKSLINLHKLANELVKNPFMATETNKEHSSKVLGVPVHAAILDDISFVEHPTLKETNLLCVPIEDTTHINAPYNRFKEFHEEIIKNMELIGETKNMGIEDWVVQPEPFQNRHERRKRAKELKRKNAKGKKK